MIQLYSTPPAWGLSTFSPFCLKAETYLRMVGLPFKIRMADIRKAPKGKIPWITDGDVTVADSTDIVHYLERKRGTTLDAGLSDEQRAQSLLLQRTMEEHTYFALAYLRWTSDAAWPHLQAAFAPLLPAVLRGVILRVIRKRIRKITRYQGIGRHSPDEILDRARRDIDAFAAVLGDRPYFMGGQPTTVDATMYGFLAQGLWTPWDSPIKDCLREKAALVAFCERMKERYFGGADADGQPGRAASDSGERDAGADHGDSDAGPDRGD